MNESDRDLASTLTESIRDVALRRLKAQGALAPFGLTLEIGERPVTTIHDPGQDPGSGKFTPPRSAAEWTVQKNRLESDLLAYCRDHEVTAVAAVNLWESMHGMAIEVQVVTRSGRSTPFLRFRKALLGWKFEAPEEFGAELNDKPAYDLTLDGVPLRPKLSPQAQEYLSDAQSELERLNGMLYRTWRLNTDHKYLYDGSTKCLTATFPGGKRAQAEAPIIGRYSRQDGSWAWAWADADLPQDSADSQALRKLGEQLDVEYLRRGRFHVPDESPLPLFAAIAVKATKSIGYYVLNSESAVYLCLLKVVRWDKAEGKD